MSATGEQKGAEPAKPPPGPAAAKPPPGVTPPGAATGRNGFLSDVIVELGFATREAVEQAVRAARSPGTTVSQVLVDMNSISEDQLARATAERYGLDYIDLEHFEVDPSATNLMEPTAAKRYPAVPVGFLGQTLLVAMADPADALAVSEIAAITGRQVRPAVASRPALKALVEALPLEEAPVRAAPGDDAGAEPEPEPTPSDDAGAEPESAEALDEPAPAGESPLRTELGSLKQQLAGAEAQLKAPGEAASDAYVAELEAKLADAQAELEGARSRVREAKEVSAELETLREALAAAEAGLHARARGGDEREVRARLISMKAECDSARSQTREVESQLHRIRAEVEVRSGELNLMRSKLTDAETELVRLRAEADTRGSEIAGMQARAESAEGHEDPEARADDARRALAELREESARERESWAMTERDLLNMLHEEERRRAELEQRLSELEGSVQDL